MGGPKETATVPGIKVKLFRGQHRADATAIGTILAPVAIASLAAPGFVNTLPSAL
jgi:hypothetical protein